MIGAEYDFAGVLKPGRHERFVDDMKARATELDFFRDKEVWTLRKIDEALSRTGKPPITVRWVADNKGDDLNSKIRSRLVASEIRLKGEEAIFAPTPPPESLRMVLSHATTHFPNETTKIWDAESPDRQMIYFVDTSRVYLNAKVDEKQPCMLSSRLRRTLLQAVARCCGDICTGHVGPRMGGSPIAAAHSSSSASSKTHPRLVYSPTPSDRLW